MNDVLLIETRYRKGEHLLYPEMVRVIDDVMKNPECEIHIPDNFLEKKYCRRNIFLALISKIKQAVIYLWMKIRSFFSKSYNLRFFTAIKKIVDAYDKKIENIYKLASTSINEQDLAVYLKNEKRAALHELRSKREALEKIDEKIQENLELKHQIVGKAKRLLEIRKGSFSSWWNGEEGETLKKEIVELDLLFEFDDIEESIGSYDENCENPCLLTQELKRDRQQQHQLSDEIRHLEGVVTGLEQKIQDAAIRNQETIERIQALTQIEDFIPVLDGEEERLLGECPSEESQAPEQHRSEAYRSMIQDVRKQTYCRDLAVLWALLLNNFENLDEHIQSWECSEEGEFTLTLAKPLKLWLDSEEATGGCIFLFGDTDSKEVKGSLGEFSIAFDEGFDSYCMYRIALFDKGIRPKMEGIFYESSQRIRMPGTCMGITRTSINAFSTLKHNWKHKVELVPDDYPGGHPAFMQKKYNAARS